MASFVHLHLHSQFSLLEATCRIKKLCERAQQLSMPAVAVTDSGNLFGAIEFYMTAKEVGVKPIIGLECAIAPTSRFARGEERDVQHNNPRRLVLLAQSDRGYQNLCQLSSIGFQEGFYYKPRVDWEILAKYSEDLIALTGGLNGDLAQTYLLLGKTAARERARMMQSIYKDRLYLEVTRLGLANEAKYEEFLHEISAELSIPLVAANNVHYLDSADQIAQDVLVCIGSNKTIHDESRARLGSDQFYFKSPAEMRHLFSDFPDLCDRSLEISERCNFRLNLKDAAGKTIYHLPVFPTEPGQSVSDLIAEKSKMGLEARFEELAELGEGISVDHKPHYYERLRYELGVIDKMGFSSYFLIVQDFINWAKEKGIPVGPGRGSGAGSLVAYSLRITDLDPVRYSLLFERFLNPERVSMPDFDIDFCQDRRHEVIDYVTQKYGEANVSQIITFGKLQARAAIKDVGRVLGMSFGDVDVISKLIPEKIGITLEDAIEQEPRIRELMDQNPQVANLLDLARRIEGLARNAGIHAAGVVIGDAPLVTYAPLYRGADGERVIQYDMKWAEKIGLIKFDFLGLKTLTHVKNALDLVESNRGRKLPAHAIPIHDHGIYELMSKGDLLGVFQFEGEGITDAVKKIRPKCFEDITAINALYRPGPMDMIPEYTRRMHGEEPVEYLFPELEEILKETYGVIIYQEQVMAIASRIASYSLGEADMLRRAMGKKIPAEMAKQKERFLDGARKNGFDPEKSAECFDLMQEFANYGFNKSHAAAYCVISAQTAWLKRYYPVEFYAALLSTEMSDTDGVVKYVKDAYSRAIKIHPPHVNFSNYNFSVNEDILIFGLGAIRGIGEAAVQAIVEARERNGGTFKDLDAFFSTVDIKKLNKKSVECLIRAGAFEGFGYHHAQLLKGFDRFMKRAEQARLQREMGQASLFSMGDTQMFSQVTLEECPSWTRMERLSSEKEVLGFFLSDHPLAGLESLHRPWTTHTVTGLKSVDAEKRAVVAGMIVSLREIINKKGARMGFAQLEDRTGTVELILFPEVFAKGENALKSDRPVLVGGEVKREDDQVRIMVDKIAILEDVAGRARRMIVRVPGAWFEGDEISSDRICRLRNILGNNPGTTKIELEIDLPQLGKRVSLDVEEPVGVRPSVSLLEELTGLVGSSEAVEVRL